MSDQMDAAHGQGRCPGVSWDDLINKETRPVPVFLRDESYEYMGSAPLAADRYISPEFFQREVAEMWPKVWQFAAREEDLPDPGDYVVYENVGRSFLLVRQQDGSIKAFYNVCLHRGRKLKTSNGSAGALQCPFHGFTWNLNGSSKAIPCSWDFAHLDPAELSLPEAQVGRWGGYVFVREAEEGPSIEEYLAPLPAFFERYRPEECVTVAWVAKVVPANWKVTAEAFMESWHNWRTHPECAPYTGDINTRYNVYGDNVNVALTPFGIPSPTLDVSDKPQQWIIDVFNQYNGLTGSAASKLELKPGQAARDALAELNRESFTQATGHDYSDALDTELLDAYVYNVFPNFSPWGGFVPTIVYRWRPWPDQDRCLMEVRLLTRVPKGDKMPRGVTMHMLSDDEAWSAAPELGSLGLIFDQDQENMPLVHEGLKASKNGQVQLANYQEIRLRHFHRTLDKYLSTNRGPENGAIV